MNRVANGETKKVEICVLLTEALLVVVGKDRFVELVVRGQPSLWPEAIWVMEVVCIVVCRPLEDSDYGLRVHTLRSVLQISLPKCAVGSTRDDGENVGLGHEV